MSSEKLCGIYFMYKGGKIVYIGQTTNYVTRLLYHKNQHIDWDKVRLIKCAPSLLNYYEKRWIKLFRPQYNICHNKTKNKPKSRKKREKYMRFRKMTRKSMIGFGKYSDYKVQHFLDTNRNIVLIDMYYNLSHITFFDDILLDLGITPEFRIEKPGTNHDKGVEFKSIHYSEEIRLRQLTRDVYIRRNANNTLKVIQNIENDKAFLRNKNQRR